ncbi:hypothetical protein ACK3TF_005861 [Chlorella vulgaris]
MLCALPRSSISPAISSFLLAHVLATALPPSSRNVKAPVRGVATQVTYGSMLSLSRASWGSPCTREARQVRFPSAPLKFPADHPTPRHRPSDTTLKKMTRSHALLQRRRRHRQPVAEAQGARRLEAAEQVQMPTQTGFRRPEAELRRQAAPEPPTQGGASAPSAVPPFSSAHVQR